MIFPAASTPSNPWPYEATAKSKAGDRLVFLDAEAAQLLREHRKAQLATSLRACEAWQDNDLVFCQPGGRPWISDHLARNQLARSIDVMLEANPALAGPLSLRKPERTFLVLLTPALMQPGRAGDAISKSRLYGWLMPAYQDPDSSSLRQHLPHRDGSELAGAAERLGWASWEDCHSVAPGACSWLTATPGTG